jgi:homoserine kinase type II
VDGRLWEVSPWLPGAADLGHPPSPAHLSAGFSGLALLHEALAEDRVLGPSASLRNRLAETDGLLLGGFDCLETALPRAGDDPRSEAARRWLALARSMAPSVRETLVRAAGRSESLQPCLRDARPDHFLFEGEHLSGLVDFGAMGIDLVEGDLARLLTEWAGTDRDARQRALAAYTAIRPLPGVQPALIDAFESSAALLGAGHWIRWHFVEERTFADPSAVGRGIDRGLERLAELAAAGHR